MTINAVLLETDATATETDARYFVYGNYIDEVLVMVDVAADPDKDYYYGHDHLYSPVVVFGPSGLLMQGERYEYDAYGQVSIMSGSYTPRSASTIGNPYTFTGRRLDVLDNGGLQLMYYRARTYDSQTGRFMQRDPLGINPAGRLENPFNAPKQYFDGMNVYEYVKGNPVNYFDPQGLGSYNPGDGPLYHCFDWFVDCCKEASKQIAISVTKGALEIAGPDVIWCVTKCELKNYICGEIKKAGAKAIGKAIAKKISKEAAGKFIPIANVALTVDSCIGHFNCLTDCWMVSFGW